MPAARLPKAVEDFLSVVKDRLASAAREQAYGPEDVEVAFTSVVESLPDCDLKQNLSRRSAVCVDRLVRAFCGNKVGAAHTGSEYQFDKVSLYDQNGLQTCLSQSKTSSSPQSHQLLLLSATGQQQADLIIKDFFKVKLSQKVDPANIAMCIRLIMAQAASCRPEVVLCALVNGLENHMDQLMSSMKVHRSTDDLIATIENLLQVVHYRQKFQSLVYVDLNCHTQDTDLDEGYFDMVAVIASWLLDLHLKQCQDCSTDQLETISERMIALLSVLFSGAAAHHVFDVLLQVSETETNVQASLLLLLFDWSLRCSQPLTQPSVYIKFVACTRRAMHLAVSVNRQSMSTAFCSVLLGAAVPTRDVHQWLKKVCSRSLYEALAVKTKWSAEKLSKHLLGVSDDIMEQLLDAVSYSSAPALSTKPSVSEDTGTSLPIVEVTDDKGSGLFFMDAVGDMAATDGMESPMEDHFTEDADGSEVSTSVPDSATEDEMDSTILHTPLMGNARVAGPLSPIKFSTLSPTKTLGHLTAVDEGLECTAQDGGTGSTKTTHGKQRNFVDATQRGQLQRIEDNNLQSDSEVEDITLVKLVVPAQKESSSQHAAKDDTFASNNLMVTTRGRHRSQHTSMCEESFQSGSECGDDVSTVRRPTVVTQRRGQRTEDESLLSGSEIGTEIFVRAEPAMVTPRRGRSQQTVTESLQSESEAGEDVLAPLKPVSSAQGRSQSRCAGNESAHTEYEAGEDVLAPLEPSIATRRRSVSRRRRAETAQSDSDMGKDTPLKPTMGTRLSRSRCVGNESTQSESEVGEDILAPLDPSIATRRRSVSRRRHAETGQSDSDMGKDTPLKPTMGTRLSQSRCVGNESTQSESEVGEDILAPLDPSIATRRKSVSRRRRTESTQSGSDIGQDTPMKHAMSTRLSQSRCMGMESAQSESEAGEDVLAPLDPSIATRRRSVSRRRRTEITQSDSDMGEGTALQPAMSTRRSRSRCVGNESTQSESEVGEDILAPLDPSIATRRRSVSRRRHAETAQSDSDIGEDTPLKHAISTRRRSRTQQAGSKGTESEMSEDMPAPCDLTMATRKRTRSQCVGSESIQSVSEMEENTETDDQIDGDLLTPLKRPARRATWSASNTPVPIRRRAMTLARAAADGSLLSDTNTVSSQGKSTSTPSGKVNGSILASEQSAHRYSTRSRQKQL